MDTTYKCSALLDGGWDIVAILAGQDECDFAVFSEDFGDVLVAAFLGYSVEGVVDFSEGVGLDGILEAGYDGFITFSVVDYGVTFATVDEGFDEGFSSAGDGNNGVDV